MTTYRVPFENGESAFTEKRSRFISHIWRVETEVEARERIEEMKFSFINAVRQGTIHNPLPAFFKIHPDHFFHFRFL